MRSFLTPVASAVVACMFLALGAFNTVSAQSLIKDAGTNIAYFSGSQNSGITAGVATPARAVAATPGFSGAVGRPGGLNELDPNPVGGGGGGTTPGGLGAGVTSGNCCGGGGGGGGGPGGTSR